MEDFLFSINATLPIFLMIAVGMFLRKCRIFTEPFCAAADKFVFYVAGPVLLFQDLSKTDLSTGFDGGFLLFCAGATVLSVLVIWVLTRLFLKDRSQIGEFVQGCYRSSSAVLGTALMLNMYGHSGMIPLMILGSVPFYNLFAVLILTVENPKEQGAPLSEGLKKVGKELLRNPMIIGIVLGLLASLLGVGRWIETVPVIDKTIANLASLTAPLALLSIGASFRGREALAKIVPTTVATAVKLIVLPAAFLPVALALGFRGEALVSLIVMLGSITTPTAYVMSKNMGHEGTLTASIIVSTTAISLFTLTGWIYLVRLLGAV